MSIRKVVGAALVALLVGAPVLFVGSPAFGQAAEPCPPGQPSDRPPGTPVDQPPGQPGGRPPQYPPGKCQLRLSRSVVAAGGSLQAAGAGFAPGSTVRVAMAATSLGSATADRDGAFSAALVVPASTEPGSYTVTASGPASPGGDQVLSASLRVTGAQAGDAANGARGTNSAGGERGQGEGAEPLPRTGTASTLPLVLTGGTLLAVGVGTVVLARRRRADGHPSGL